MLHFQVMVFLSLQFHSEVKLEEKTQKGPVSNEVSGSKQHSDSFVVHFQTSILLYAAKLW